MTIKATDQSIKQNSLKCKQLVTCVFEIHGQGSMNERQLKTKQGKLLSREQKPIRDLVKKLGGKRKWPYLSLC